ncbi:MAG: glycosyltransferase [Candidatus Wallbacteria bacterium]|nr:glycosyltransferase [Candidatus Wallbacteria bacterium]
MHSLNYLGLLRSVVSWARIGREICASLNHLCDLSIVEQKGHLYQPNIKLSPELEAALKKERNLEAELAFIMPLFYDRLEARFKIGGMVYETSELPKQWVERINRHLNLLWVPNQFNRKLAERSGVKIPLLIAPYGVNRKNFYPQTARPVRDKFIFVTVAMPQKRKGLLELINCFYQAFSGRDDVELRIKLPYRTGKFHFEYREGELEAKVRDHRVKIIEERFLTDDGLREFLWQADCYVQPSRSEGLGMVLLEATACGLPVIACPYGGPAEFLGPENSFLIDYELREAGEIQYENSSATAIIAEPKWEELTQALWSASQNRELCCQKMRNAQEMLPHFDWDLTAGKLIAAINGADR